MPEVKVQNKRFPNNQDLSGGGDYNVVSNSTIHLEAPSLSEPDPSNPGEYFNYNFLFWNVQDSDGTAIHQIPSIDVNVKISPLVATAWYIRIGESGECVKIRPWAFSQSQNAFINDSPIQSVTPSNAMPASEPGVVYTNSSNVEIHAKNSIDGEDFNHWILFGAGTISASTISVSQGHCPLTISSYRIPVVSDVFVDPSMWNIIEALNGAKRILDRIDEIADPAPIDYIRAGEFLRKQSLTRGSIDELTDVVKNIKSLSSGDMKIKVSEIKSQMTRLEEAKKLLDTAIAKSRKRK